MKKLRLLIELEYDDQTMHGEDEDSEIWFFEEVLLQKTSDDSGLVLHSNLIGDEVGAVNVLRVDR
jgi:hypothetical protein